MSVLLAKTWWRPKAGDAEYPWMIDYIALALTHGLIVLAALRLFARADLDRDPALEEAEPVAPIAEPAKRGMRRA